MGRATVSGLFSIAGDCPIWLNRIYLIACLPAGPTACLTARLPDRLPACRCAGPVVHELRFRGVSERNSRTIAGGKEEGGREEG